MSVRLQHVEPPRGVDIELRVLSSLCHLGEPNDLRIQKAMLTLDAECFFNTDTRELFEIIRRLFVQKKEFSLVTLLGLIPSHIFDLVSKMMLDAYCSLSMLEMDVGLLIDYRIYRKQLRILTSAVNLSLEQLTPEESIKFISEELQAIAETNICNNKPFKRTSADILDEILTNGYVIGADFLVDIPNLPPVPDESMITIAGRSGHGKTFFSIYLMDKIIEAKPGKQALYFNLEMREPVLLERLALLNGFRGENQLDILNKAASCIVSKNLTIFTKDATTIDEIETEARLSAMQCPLSVIVVDYMNLVRSKKKYERQELEQSDIGKRLAGLATSLKCVVLCLIQVNRDIKTRPISERCPIPTDSAESMGAVNSCSWWLGINQPQTESDEMEWQDVFQIKCRKTRGDTGVFELQLKFKYGMFSKWVRPMASSYGKKPVEPVGF